MYICKCFWFVYMFLKNIQKWTYVEQGIEVPFLGLLKSWLYRKQNQLLSPSRARVASDSGRGLWKQRARGRRVGSWSWCPGLRTLPWAVGLNFSPISACGVKLPQCLPLIAQLKMATCVGAFFFFFNLTHVLVVPCVFGWVVLIRFPNNYSTSE